MPIKSIPSALQSLVEKQLADYANHDDFAQLAQQYPDLHESLPRVFIASDFVAENILHYPPLWVSLVESGDLTKNYSSNTYYEQLTTCVEGISTERDLHRVLREFRRREMLRLIWRNALQLSDVVTITQELTWLADACLEIALKWLTQFFVSAWGIPTINNEPQQLIILGMGKLGGAELNLSSDIDLMFVYSEEGETVGGDKNLTHHEYFTRIGQKLIQAIGNRTEDGFVFRVDMRLRPYGQSGALVLSMAAMEEYYQDQGREWERYAMIKARVVAGDKVNGELLLKNLKPFVYRRYIDFGVIESLREMKALIAREVRTRKGDNVKVGEGGIREIEFIAQAFQLMRGGRDKQLQEKHLLTTLAKLGELNYLDEPIVDELTQAYLFLRNTEHALQALNDEQTQILPEDATLRQRIAFVLGFVDWSSFYEQLQKHRARVSFHFSQIVASQEEDSDRNEEATSAIWAADFQDEEAAQVASAQLAQLGYQDAPHVIGLLRALKNNRAVQAMQDSARLRLDTCMPRLLKASSAVNNPTQTISRILPLIESVIRRTAYLLLLNENPQALKQLITLCSASPWIAEQLAHAPLLLDELIDPQVLYSPLDKISMQQELRQQLLRLPEDDLEQHMESLRYFKNAHSLRIAACEITGVLPLMKVSDYLTYLAEVILEEALAIAWRYLIDKHGVPQKNEGIMCNPDFIIVAYGKLAGLELGHGSDLDLVFLHDADINLSTVGAKPIDNTVFFTRLAQRIIHLINTPTASGVVYEVDTRLRPSGTSGLLVTSLHAFEEYQTKQAWTWEHQALVRSRAVAGDSALATRFEKARVNILTTARDLGKLKEEVISMRQKMREHLATPAADENTVFDVKHDRGGIVDIEFMVQYECLAWAHQHPSLVHYSDNIRELEALAATQVLSAEDAQFLTDAYKAYRERAHQLALQKQPSKVGGDEFRQMRAGVVELWNKLLTVD
jgi:glutamate-ammonia-ligase adenylyltransferase